jgi:hypothetical protein
MSDNTFLRGSFFTEREMSFWAFAKRPMWRHRNVAAMKETFIINFHFWGQNTPCLSQLVLE